RIKLLRLAEQSHVLLINIHHITLDGVSFNIIANELATLYNSIVQGEAAQLPPQPIQYVDYAVWQREQLQGENWQRLLDYWQTKLAASPATLPLPTDNPYPTQPTSNGATVYNELGSDLMQQLKAICQREAVTLHTLLLTTYQWLLYRYTKETVIPVGEPYANRAREETASLIGFFVNTLVFAAEFTDVHTFQALLARVHNDVLQGIDHAEMPFDKLVMALDKQRSHNRSPLFQTFFSVQSGMLDLTTFAGLKMQVLDTAPNTAKFELLLSVTDNEESLDLAFEYNKDLFSAETIQTISQHYHTLLLAISNNLATSLHDPLLLLSEEERATVASLQQQLNHLPTVRSAVVAPLYDAPQGAKLGAWITGIIPADKTINAQIITLDQLPLDSTGATDFSRLPYPKPQPATDTKPTLTRAERLAAKRAKLAARRKKLSAEQKQKLTKLVQKGQQEAVKDKILKRDPTVVVPLSFAQERLWFLDQLTPNSPAYNMPFRITFHDPINIKQLSLALSTMLARHEILRTHFEQVDALPIQIVSDYQAFELPVHEVATEADLQQFLAADASQPFDLTVSPLMRASLVKLASKSVLLLTFHHIILDGWSWSLFINELTTIYATLLSGKELAVPPSDTLQYADFSLWQRQKMAEGALQNQLAYWVNQLANVPTQLALPYDHAHTTKTTAIGAVQSININSQNFIHLVQAAQAQGASLYMLLTAVYALLLQRYSGQDDFLIGSVLANRNHQTEKMLGFFANTLPLRMRFTGAATFREFLHQVRHTVLDSFDNQDIAFEQIVAAVQPDRNTAQQPLLQTLFLLQNLPQTQQKAGSLPIRMEEWGQMSDTAKFDLLLAATELDKGIEISAEYNADLF
ncbi:MAG TPA: hypothetical protein ENJ56_08040, partial [Anaerolineae bacterium]|nr:hypothetical protein [Anaerolineae bacterium]